MIIKKFIEDSKFFFTDFHTGVVNILLHIISVVVFVYGLFTKNLILALVGLAVIDELGHVYNFCTIHKNDQKYNPLKMVPYQILYVIPPALILLKLFGLI